MHQRIYKLSKAVHKLYEISQVVPIQWQSTKGNAFGAERRHGAICIEVIKLLKLCRGQIVHGPTLYRFSDDEKEALAKFELG